MEPLIQIRHGSYIMKVSLVDVPALKPHEEVIPGMVRKLQQSMLRTGIFTHPIVVDENTLVILDGMHRYNALKELGARYVPAMLVNYLHKEIKLKRWWRVTPRFAYKVIRLRFKRPPSTRAPKSKFHILIRRNDVVEYYVFQSLSELCNELNALEKSLRENGLEPTYVHEDELDMLIKDSQIAFAPPRLEKEQVIELALSGNLLPHKSTCHVFPARIYDVNIPLDILFMDNLDEAAALARKMLANRKIVRKNGKFPNAELRYTLLEAKF